MLVDWPAPKALEGVKSKKRAIFKVEAPGKDVDRDCHGTVWSAAGSGLSLGLESRVVALGPVSGALAAALAEDETPAAVAGVWRSKGLAAVRLTGGLAGPEASAKAHVEAVTAALKARPHVVVLEEDACGAAAWPGVFHSLLRSDGLRGFGGAVVVCCREETFAVRALCSRKWLAVADGTVGEEAVQGRQLEVIEDVLASLAAATEAENGPGRKKGGRKGSPSASDELESLLEEARALGDFQFEGDMVGKARKEGWIITLLVEATAEGSRAMRGFMCHRLQPAPRAELYIDRLAVPQKCRGRGFARQLVRWAEEEASRFPPEVCSAITCSALDAVVPFYKKLGFVVAPAPAPEQAQEVCDEDPQTFMERRLAPQASA